MSYAGEKDLRYRLVKSSDTKRDSYHAVMRHEALTVRASGGHPCAQGRFRTDRTALGKSPKRFGGGPKMFFAQCFQGSREGSG